MYLSLYSPFYVDFLSTFTISIGRLFVNLYLHIFQKKLILSLSCDTIFKNIYAKRIDIFRLMYYICIKKGVEDMTLKEIRKMLHLSQKELAEKKKREEAEKTSETMTVSDVPHHLSRKDKWNH